MTDHTASSSGGSTGPFLHYPASPDDVLGAALGVNTSAAAFDDVVTDLGTGVQGARANVGGLLDGPVATVDAPVARTGGELTGAARFAAGALLTFTEAIERFNKGADGLNARVPSAPIGLRTEGNPSGKPEQADLDAHADAMAGLRAEYRWLQTALDQDGDDTAAMLGRGPNESDINAMEQAGLYPGIVPSDDAALQSAFDKTGKNFPNAAFPVDDLEPGEVARWWAVLTPAERLAVLQHRARRMGNTDGLPADVRDEGNRVALGEDLERLTRGEQDGTLDGRQKQELRNVRRIAEQLDNAESHEDPITGEHTGAQLYIYDPGAFDGEGRSAIVTGNADTADNVAWVVPGADTDVENHSVGRAGNVYDESQRLNGGTASTAVVTWIGYDTPEWNTSVVTEGRADAGADLLAGDVAGLGAGRSNDDPHTTVIGHSYGSTTVAKSGIENDLGAHADDIVLIGSPGASGADSADDLGVGSDHVWVGANSSDPISYLGGTGWVNLSDVTLGNDPAEDDFGANRFRAEAEDRASWVGFADHSKYFDTGSESLYNIANVVNGEHGDIVQADHRYDPWYDEAQDPEREREPGPAPR